jgi:hypothetical protein
MKYELLRDLADVQTGITLRGEASTRHDPKGTHRLIRIGDVSLDGFLAPNSSSKVRLSEAEASKFVLKPGNVLLAARGSRLTAAVFDLDEPAVAGNQFIIIRIRPQWLGLRAGFLAWYLNLTVIQDQLAASMRGTYIRSLPAGILSMLQVPVPDGAKQDVITNLHNLRVREKTLMEQLAHQRSQLIDQLAITSINFNPHDNHVLG